MSQTTYKEPLAFAKRLAAEAGDMIMARWGNAPSRTKADGSFVTEADIEAEEHILRAIDRRFPECSVLAEESSEQRKPKSHEGLCWVVDPLDGTRNFMRGFACFATSIALLENGVPVVGVVREHNTDQLFVASAGGGATWNGVPMQMKHKPLDRDFFIGVPSIKITESPEPIKRSLMRINIRNVGSTAMHLAMVACGAIDAMYAQRCYAWDIAAGYVLVTESGGVCTDLSGGPCHPLPPMPDPLAPTPCLASGPESHAELIKLLDV